MYHNMAYSNRAKKVNAYLVKDVLDASPQKLLLKVYDFAIANCKRGNLEKTNKALNELINALNFEDENTKEFSTGLLALYKYCQDQMRKRNYDIVAKILTELRHSWLEAFSNKA